MKFDEKTLSSKTIFHNDFLTLNYDEVLLPNDLESSRVYVKHIGAACCLPITSDGKIILTRQYRYPIRKVAIEIPAGKKDRINEDGLECIKRELEEETGYQSNEFEKLMDIHNCLGYSDELIEIYIAYNCEKALNPIECDEDEFIEVFLTTKEEAMELLTNGDITDVKTIIALQHYLYKK